MLSRLEHVRAGISSASELKRTVFTKRAFNLQIVRDWDLEDGHSGGINCMDLDPSEHRYLLSGATDGGICVHDLLNYYGKISYTAKVLHRIEKYQPGGHKYSVECLQWYPFDSGLFVSSGMDKMIKMWDSNLLAVAYETQLPGRIYHHGMSKIPSQNYLVAATTTEKNVTILDLKSGSKSHELVGHNAGVLTCHWSPRDDSLLATGGVDGQILLWDIRSAKACLKSLDQHNGQENGGRLTSFTAHNGYVNSIRFTENGFFMVSYGDDSRLRAWDVLNGTNLMVNFGTAHNKLKRPIQLDIASCHKERDLVFVPSGNNVSVYEIMSGIRVKRLMGHFDIVCSCVFDPWYQQLLTGSRDRTILCWSNDAHQMVDTTPVVTKPRPRFTDNWDD